MGAFGHTSHKKLMFWLLVLVLGASMVPSTAFADFGLDPGKVYIDNLKPGSEADVPMTVFNKGDQPATFVIVARTPDYTDPAYEAFPYLGWITIKPAQVTVAAGGKATVTAVIIMPKDAVYAGKKAEVWISFKEKGAPGMIQIEMASRLFISTAGAVKETTPAPTTSSTVVTSTASRTTTTPTSVTSTATSVVPVSSTAPATTVTAAPAAKSSVPAVAILGTALGVVVVGALAYLMTRKKRKA